MPIGLGIMMRNGGSSGPPLVPPVYPALPIGGVLHLAIDGPRIKSGANLTSWTNTASGALYTVPGGSTGFVCAANGLQAFDSQHLPSTSYQLSSATETPWTSGQARTISVMGSLDDAGSSLAVPLASGGTGPILIAGGNFLCTGSANIATQPLYYGSQGVFVWSFTPGGAAVTGTYYHNGWPVTGLRAGPSGISGTWSTDGGSAGVLIGNRGADAQFWDGLLQEEHGYPSILGATDLASLLGQQAWKGCLCGIKGWVADSPEIPFNGLFQYINSLASLAVHRFYTTAASGTVTLFAQQSTGLGVTSTNLPVLEVYIDGVHDQTITVTPNSAPYAPSSYVLTSAKLDGNAHLLEVVNGPSSQNSVAPPGVCVLSSLQDPAGLTKPYPAAIPPNRIVVSGDSNTLGYGGSGANVASGAWQTMRYTPAQFNGRVSFWSTSGREIFTERNWDATFASTIAALVAMLSEVQSGGTSIMVIPIGVNDWAGATYSTASAWATDVATMITGVQTACSGLPFTLGVIWQAPCITGTEGTTNANGWTMANLRSAASTKAAAIGVHYDDLTASLNGVPAIQVSDLAGDNVHIANQSKLNLRLAASVANFYPGAV